jgi:hypothetical protein
VGTERFERSTSPKEIQLYRLARPTDIRLMPVIDLKSWRRGRDSNAHVPRDAGLANRWDNLLPNFSDTQLLRLPNLSELPNLSLKLTEGRRFELLCAEAAPVFRTGGPPFARTLRLVWWLVTESNGLFGFSDRLCHPTRSNQPYKKVEARRRIELRVNRFAGGAVTVSLRALVPEEGIEPPCTRRWFLRPVCPTHPTASGHSTTRANTTLIFGLITKATGG